MPLRLLMMGTGTFALPTFEALCVSPHPVVGLVTQPDRMGRGHHHHPHPMKAAAVERGVPVFQPENVNAPDALERLHAFGADLYVVAAYGQILSPELLAIPPLGAVNVHASLLPKYRGAAPVQYAILRGETETGVTIFRIEPRLDAGPILGMVRTPIGERETSGDLERRLAALAAPLTREVVDGLAAGTIRPQPQDPALVSRAPKLKKEQGLIDWTRSASEIDRHVRGMQPWPMPYSFLHAPGRPPLRLLVLEVIPAAVSPPAESRPGEVLSGPPGRLFVRCGGGAVELLRLQPAGKRSMSAEEFLRGHAVTPACRFGPAAT